MITTLVLNVQQSMRPKQAQTKKDIEDLCPTAKWDEIFASQYDSVITTPAKNPEPNNAFVIPS